MNIYSFPTFNLVKVLLTAEELGLDYQLHLLDAQAGEHKTPVHLQRHPLGKVPAVELDGNHYFESNSICRLLAERSGNRLYADSPESRARINQWVDLMALHIGRHLTVLVFEEVVRPKALGGNPDGGAVEEATQFLTAQLPVIEKQLSAHPFLAGDDLTIADLIGFSYCHTHELTSASFDDYPAVLAWYHRIKGRPAFEQAMERLPGGKLFAFL
ncbi:MULTISPECIES: glutathione S-transferase family protein [unclassified Microbulbifer]|uniref:glutathione S-transferase family protein n=1 Tax=unclassified Microbulbifer TaxID=2619833 RepID=UPI0027E5A5BA|nr:MULTISPECIES: glutathione S-transferase family protein [unclassified Microbulbifer]